MSRIHDVFTIDNFRKYGMLYIAFSIYSGITVCAKMAALYEYFSLPFLLYIALEIVLLCVYAVLWQQVLKKFSLMSAMANKGIVVVFTLLWSVLFFRETITLYNIIGALVIILGIRVVSKDG